MENKKMKKAFQRLPDNKKIEAYEKMLVLTKEFKEKNRKSIKDLLSTLEKNGVDKRSGNALKFLDTSLVELEKAFTIEIKNLKKKVKK